MSSGIGQQIKHHPSQRWITTLLLHRRSIHIITKADLGRWKTVWVAFTHASSFNYLLNQARLGYGDGVVLGIHVELDSEVLSRVTILGLFKSSLVQLFHEIVDVLLVGGSTATLQSSTYKKIIMLGLSHRQGSYAHCLQPSFSSVLHRCSYQSLRAMEMPYILFLSCKQGAPGMVDLYHPVRWIQTGSESSAWMKALLKSTQMSLQP